MSQMNSYTFNGKYNKQSVFLTTLISELKILISEHKLTFDITEISKSWLKLNKTNLNSVQIPGYNFEFIPTECNNGGTAIYIKKN